MPLHTLSELRALALRGKTVETLAHVQVDANHAKTTKDGKPYREIHFVDARDRVVLRAWSDAPVYPLCVELASGHCVEIAGEFCHHASFGLEARRWTFRPLAKHEQAALMVGPLELRERQEAGYTFILECLENLRDPRLRYVWELFLAEHGERFRRTAAARSYHHARRGGLVEHVAGMMRAAVGIAGAYPRLNRDLLVTGVLFHDCGKLWENHVPESAFSIEHCEQGELLGHINMGIEIVNGLWRRMRASSAFAGWRDLHPPCESVRLHLLHLVASHHGELAFGSPVLPKTPEAIALHYVDNLDAKLEMMFGGLDAGKEVAPNVYDKVRPLNHYLIAPLPACEAPAETVQEAFANGRHPGPDALLDRAEALGASSPAGYFAVVSRGGEV